MTDTGQGWLAAGGLLLIAIGAAAAIALRHRITANGTTDTATTSAEEVDQLAQQLGAS